MPTIADFDRMWEDFEAACAAADYAEALAALVLTLRRLDRKPPDCGIFDPDLCGN